MQIEDSEFEIFVVPVAVGVALQGSNLTVDHFQLSGADAVFVPVQDKWLPRQEPWINFSTGSFCKVFQTKSLRVFVQSYRKGRHNSEGSS